MISSKQRNEALSPAKVKPPSKLKRAENRTGFLLVLPALVTFCVIILYPFLRALSYSFFEYTLFTPQPVFAGLENFREILTNPRLLGSWLRTLIFVAGTTGLTFVLGLTWAILMHQRFRGRIFIRSASLLPWVFPSVVTAFLWAWIYNGQYGVLNALLLKLGIVSEPVVWLSTSAGAMAAVVMAKAWVAIPLFMAFFLAGLQGLPTERLDAARVDGANNLEVLRYVALPHLRSTMAIVLVLGAIGNLQQFDIIYTLTAGGPIRATTVLSIEVYKQAFENWNTGLAAAIGVLWLLTIAIPAFFYLRTALKREDT